MLRLQAMQIPTSTFYRWVERREDEKRVKEIYGSMIMAILTVITTRFNSLKKEYYLICSDMSKPLNERNIIEIKTTHHECFSKSFPDTIDTDDINENGIYGRTIEENLIDVIKADKELFDYVLNSENIKDFNETTPEERVCKNLFKALSTYLNAEK